MIQTFYLAATDMALAAAPSAGIRNIDLFAKK